MEGGGGPCCALAPGTEFCCAGILGDQLGLLGDTNH